MCNDSQALKASLCQFWDVEWNEIESCCVLRWFFLVTPEKEKPRNHPCFTLFSLRSLSFLFLLSYHSWIEVINKPKPTPITKVLSIRWLPDADHWWMPGLCMDMHSCHLNVTLLMSTKNYLWRVRVEGWGWDEDYWYTIFSSLVFHSWCSWQLWLSARGGLSRERQFCYLARSSMFSFDTLMLAGISSSVDIVLLYTFFL